MALYRRKDPTYAAYDLADPTAPGAFANITAWLQSRAPGATFVQRPAAPTGIFDIVLGDGTRSGSMVDLRTPCVVLIELVSRTAATIRPRGKFLQFFEEIPGSV